MAHFQSFKLGCLQELGFKAVLAQEYLPRPHNIVRDQLSRNIASLHLRVGAVTVVADHLAFAMAGCALHAHQAGEDACMQAGTSNYLSELRSAGTHTMLLACECDPHDSEQ